MKIVGLDKSHDPEAPRPFRYQKGVIVHNHGTFQNEIRYTCNPEYLYIFELSSSFHVDWRLKSRFWINLKFCCFRTE